MPECELEKELNKCPYYENGHCKKEGICSFQKKIEKKEYIRKERWYEKYYKR